MSDPNNEYHSDLKLKEFEQFFKEGTYAFLTEDEWEDLYQYLMFEETIQLKKKLYFLVNEALAQHKFSVFFTLRMAEIKGKTESKEAALAYLELAESLSPEDPEVYECKAHIYESFKDYNNAIINYKLALKLQGDVFDLMFQMALCQSNDQRTKDAFETFGQLAKIQPKNEFVLDHIALLVFDNEWFKEGVQIFEEIIDLNPYSETAWHYLGNAKSSLEEYESAIWAQEMALAINENSFAGLFGLASVYQDKEDFETAKAKYLLVLNQFDDDCLTYVNLGYCCEKLEQFEQARVYYRKAIALDISTSAAWYGIGLSLISENKIKESIYFFANAYQYGKNEESHYGLTLASVYIDNQQYEEAEVIFDTLIRLFPDEFEIWIDYSTLFSEQMQVHKAKDALETALFYLPDNHQINYRLAALYLSLNDAEKSRHHLEKALKNNYKDHKLLFTFNPHLRKNQALRAIIKQYKK